MKPPVSYFGGKSRIAPWIASLFPPHRVYVEPFMGSAAVFFAKAPTKHAILNDLDGDVVNFFRMLRDRPDDLERVCRLTPYAREEYDASVRTELADVVDELERARLWWVRSSQSFGAVTKRGTGWSTSIAQNSNNGRTVLNRLDRFADSAHRLLEATIECTDALTVIDRYDAADALMYVDPPYLADVRTSFRDGRRPGGDYVHEFHSDDDHCALAAVLTEARAHVVVSGYASTLYDRLFDGWDRVERRVLARASQRRGGELHHRVEVLWSNRPLEHRLDFSGDPEVESLESL